MERQSLFRRRKWLRCGMATVGRTLPDESVTVVAREDQCVSRTGRPNRVQAAPRSAMITRLPASHGLNSSAQNRIPWRRGQPLAVPEKAVLGLRSGP